MRSTFKQDIQEGQKSLHQDIGEERIAFHDRCVQSSNKYIQTNNCSVLTTQSRRVGVALEKHDQDTNIVTLRQANDRTVRVPISLEECRYAKDDAIVNGYSLRIR